MRWIVGLVAITILFSVYNLFMIDESWFMHGLSRPERHVIKFASILIVYGMGVMAFGSRSPAWLLSVWNILYGVLLSMLVMLGLFDTYISPFSPAFRSLGISLHVFLISPAPYVFLAIVGRAAERMPNGG